MCSTNGTGYILVERSDEYDFLKKRVYSQKRRDNKFSSLSNSRSDSVKGVLVAAAAAAELMLGPTAQFHGRVRANDLVALFRERLIDK
jgi:hypothetical protein